ncbi:MAG: undecaprenyl/decaprenyl-phosphate alpha-N-acetylglucosaminyl 1-phosphate transferase [Lentisphaeria bacterium]|nr:undecaprenyl/decaprenyl-phosphate alpha-N-acetylglucosaminyl 1-phosphate transferase [Lentisphaeria bacterium]
MKNWILVYILTFSGALLCSAMATVFFRKIAWKTDFLDRPAANHKGHAKATALLGGAAMFCSWAVCAILGSILFFTGACPEFLEEIFQKHQAGLLNNLPQMGFVFLGALLAVLLGLADDKWALSAGTKFAGQFLIALLAVFGGDIKINFFITVPWISSALSVFWIVLMMNSINFFDNMDGLATGTIAIAMMFFTVIAGMNGEYFMAVFAALNCGVCCGFWFFNANPATIFMGDSGSHLLGYLAAVTAVAVTFFDQGASLTRFPVIIPAFILALPLFDTAMVVAIRTLNRKPFWIGDHNHISHRFVRMGLSRKNAVILVHLLAFTIGLGALPIYWGDFKTATVILMQMFLLLVIITVIQLHLSEKDDARD